MLPYNPRQINYDSYISHTCHLTLCALCSKQLRSHLLLHCSGTWVSAAPVSISERLCVVQKQGHQCLRPLVLPGPVILHQPICKLLASQNSGSSEAVLVLFSYPFSETRGCDLLEAGRLPQYKYTAVKCFIFLEKIQPVTYLLCCFSK